MFCMAFSVGVCIVSVTEPLLFFFRTSLERFQFNSGTQLTSITQSSRELNLNRINDGHIFSSGGSSSWLHLIPGGLMIVLISRGFCFNACSSSCSNKSWRGFPTVIKVPLHILLSAGVWRLGVCLHRKAHSPITSFSDRFRWFWQLTQNGSCFYFVATTFVLLYM